MVSILYGRAGTGKTHMLENEARRLLKEGARVFFVVPEQLSISREFSFNKAGLHNIEVLSFSRLSNTIFRTLGGTAKKLPDSAMSAAALYRAVMNVYGELTYYKSVAFSQGFISKLTKTFSEFDTCRISLESIEAIPGDALPRSVLGKYRDLFTIYYEYKRLWTDEYKAPGEDITQAAGMLELSGIFSDAVFMFDGFYGFTKQQTGLIEQLILQAAGCFFAFTTDLQSELFTTVTAEAHKIAALCKKRDVPYSFIPSGDVSYRLKTDSQQFLEKYAMERRAPVFNPDENMLTVFAADNPGSELNFIACKIKNDILSGKYRCRDIAVLSPDSDGMSAAASAVFAKHGVPAFTDVKKTLLSMPLTSVVLSALETAAYGFTYENVFSFLKTGLAGLSFDEISILENYVRMWKIKKNGWLTPWTQSPNGLSGNGTKREDEGEKLSVINELRVRAISPLAAFADEIKARSCRRKLCAVCSLFDRLGISEKLLERAQYFESTGSLHLSDEYTRVYEIFINMLDSVDAVFGEEELGTERFYDILSLCAGAVTVSSRPACADEVIFSGIGRVRTENIKCIYICRMNDGLIPRPPAGGELITDADKRIFSGYGIAASMDFIQSAQREKFDFYSALTAASHELVLSYSMFEITGESLMKSEFLENIKRLTNITELAFDRLPPEFHLSSIAAASDFAAKTADPALTAAVYEAGGIVPVKREKTDRLADEIVYGLYSKNLRLSFSGIEEFIGCPFRFFIHRGLRAQKNETVEMTPSNIGTFIHYGLERLLSGEFDLDGDIDEHTEKISREYMDGVLFDCKGRSKRFDWIFSRAKTAFRGAAKNIVKEIHGSDFVPFDFEIDISQYEKPAELQSGCTLSLIGSIDRVDMLEKDGIRLAKIIDYKSGSQEFSLKKIYNGLSMQLPIYAGAVKSKYPDARIAAMYYLKVGVPDVKLSDKAGTDERTYTEKTDEYYKRDGVFCDSALSSSRLGDGIKSLCTVKKDRILTQSGIDALIGCAREKINETGSKIMNGCVEISPVSDSKINVCEYCDYKDICKIGQNPDSARALADPPDNFLKEEDS